ncbi:MAG: acyl carrier protein [Holophagales bacterium]|nr:acyl carrier protein [Holophagales bacterium]
MARDADGLRPVAGSRACGADQGRALRRGLRGPGSRSRIGRSSTSNQRSLTVSATESRIQELARQHLDIGRDLDLDAGLLSSDISSLDAVAFVKKVGEAFGVEVPPEEVANWKNLRDFAAFLDSGAS